MTEDRMITYYADSVKRFKECPPTLAQVDRLAWAAKSGDKRAKDKLCRALASIVEVAVSKRARLAEARGLTRNDLRQAAMLAILEKLQRWDGRTAFRTYAFELAKFAVLSTINSSRLVSIDRGIAEEARTERWRTDRNYSEEMRKAAVRAIQPTSSLSPIPGADDLDISREEPGYEAVLDLDQLQRVWKSAYITDTHRDAIVGRLWGEKPLRVLAKERGVSRSRIEVCYKHGIHMLRVCAGTERPDEEKRAVRVA